MRRSTIIASSVLLLVGLLIGALWASSSERTPRNEGAAAEIAALREAEAKRRPASAPKARTAPALCRALDASKVGTVADGNLDELSGLVASRRAKGLFWGIEDSGANPTLSAFRTSGAAVGDWTLAGAENVDWEDLATGPGPNGPVLYAADIGDNDAVRDSVSVYRVAEPSSPAGGGTTAPAERLELTYPDGAHDAETLFVDPKRGTLVVVTKGLTGGDAYALSPPLPFGGRATLRKVTGVPVPLATAGDVSADGATIAVRGYFSLSVWRRRGSEPITQAMTRDACTSPTALDDGQGEAIALSPGGSTAWTVAEGKNPNILRLTPQR